MLISNKRINKGFINNLPNYSSSLSLKFSKTVITFHYTNYSSLIFHFQRPFPLPRLCPAERVRSRVRSSSIIASWGSRTSRFRGDVWNFGQGHAEVLGREAEHHRLALDGLHVPDASGFIGGRGLQLELRDHAALFGCCPHYQTKNDMILVFGGC